MSCWDELVDWEVDGMDEKQSSSGRERHKVLVAL